MGGDLLALRDFAIFAIVITLFFFFTMETNTSLASTSSTSSSSAALTDSAASSACLNSGSSQAVSEQALAQMISDGFDKAKAGDARKVYDAVHGCSSKIPSRSHYAFGWIIYYALHQSHGDISFRKHLLAEYLSLSTPRPHKLHSMFLQKAIQLYKDVKNAQFNAHGNSENHAPGFSILRFIALWNLENLREGDWRRKEFNGKPMSSTAEKLITVCVDEADSSHILPDEKVMRVVEMAMHKFPDSASLLSQRAMLHILAGDVETAKTLLRQALVLASGKFFIWSRLASLIDINTQPRLRLALFVRALNSPGQELFKGRIHLQMAEVWASQGCFPQAVWELEKVKHLYESQHWHMPALYTKLRAAVPEDTVPENPAAIYKKLAGMTDAYVYELLPEISVKKTYHKAATSDTPIAWRVTDDNGENYWLQPHKFGLQADLPKGAALLIRVNNRKVVTARIQNDSAVNVN